MLLADQIAQEKSHPENLTIRGLLQAQAKRNPDAIAIIGLGWLPLPFPICYIIWTTLSLKSIQDLLEVKPFTTFDLSLADDRSGCFDMTVSPSYSDR
jgi:hypothetical protein